MHNRGKASFSNIMRPGARLHFRGAPETALPWIAPPICLVLAEIGSLLWLTLQIGVVLLDEGIASELATSPVLMASAVLLGAVLPMMIAYAIATNRIWSRPLIVIGVASVLGLSAWYIRIRELGDGPSLWSAAAGGLLVVSFALYLYKGRSISAYYLALRGEYDEDYFSLEPSIRESTRPAAMGSRLQTVLEYAVVATSLALLVAALVQMFS